MTPFLVGERVYLRQLVASDADGPYPTWFNDAEVCAANSHGVYPYNADQAAEYIAWSIAAARAGTDLVLAICTIADDIHIGNVALQNIHPIYRSADFAIVIGDKRAWGRGLGTEAAQLIIRHGLDNLNLVRIACGTFDNNCGMQALAVSLGMKEEGRRRCAVYKNGEWRDVIEYGLIIW